MIRNDAVWLITGCSTGLGRALAEEALAAGYRVAATARDQATIQDLVANHEGRAIALALDVTNQHQVVEAVKTTMERFGSTPASRPRTGLSRSSTALTPNTRRARPMH